MNTKKESFNSAVAAATAGMRSVKFRNAIAANKVDLLGELRKAGLKDLGE